MSPVLNKSNTLSPELERLVVLVGRHNRAPPDEVELMKELARKDPAGALMSFRTIAETEGLLSAVEVEPVQEMVRLRLTLEAKDGRRTEAILTIPRERYDGVAVLEAFERHTTAGTTRVVAVQQIEEQLPRRAPR